MDLIPDGRGGWTASGGYKVTRTGRGYEVTATSGLVRTVCPSKAAALDAVIAHQATKGAAWNLDATPCPAELQGQSCSLLRGAHKTVVDGWTAGPPKVLHQSAGGHEWTGLPA